MGIVAYSSNGYHGFTVDEALEGIAAAGFRYVELNAVKGWTEHIMPDMGEAEIERIRKKMETLGLTPIALSGHCNLMTDKRLKDFKANIHLAHRLGSRYIVTSTGEAHFGEGEEFSDEELIKNISGFIPLLEKYDMTLVIELHGVKYGSGEPVYRLTQKIGSPRIGINYDTANARFWGGVECPLEDLDTCISDVKYVHLKDQIGEKKSWNFCATGKGELPLKEFMEKLDASGYDGVYSIEVEYDEAYCMREKDQPGDLETANEAAKESYAYMKSLGRV